MARKTKTNVDYFPMDCFDSLNLDIFIAKCGVTGFGALVKIFQKIYGEEGYFCKWNKNVQTLFAFRYSIDEESLQKYVEECLNYEIFNREMYEKYGILTSEKIQSTYLEITKKRKLNLIDEKYSLVINSQEDNINDDFCEEATKSYESDCAKLTINSPEMQQIKLNKNKVNESKLNISDKVVVCNGETVQPTLEPPTTEPPTTDFKKDEEVVCSIPTSNGGEYIITKDNLNELQKKFPDLNIRLCLTKMADYYKNHSDRRLENYKSRINLWLEDDYSKQKNLITERFTEKSQPKNQPKASISVLPSYDIEEYDSFSMFD